jgi:hypothetical protein
MDEPLKDCCDLDRLIHARRDAARGMAVGKQIQNHRVVVRQIDAVVEKVLRHKGDDDGANLVALRFRCAFDFQDQCPAHWRSTGRAC